MEYFYVYNNVDSKIEKLGINNSKILSALEDIKLVLNQTIRNDFRLLCAIRLLVEESTYGNLIISGKYAYLKSTMISDSALLKILNDMFNFSEDYIYKLVRIGSQFIQGDVAENMEFVLPQFKNMTISKLKELLPLEIDKIKKAFSTGEISANSTVKEIRAYVKYLIKGPKPQESEKSLDEQEKELDKAFDPHEDYTYEYFKSKCKLDLVEICLQYQRYVKRLTNKTKNK